MLPAVLLAAALVLGAARLWHLGTWSLWLDEAFTLADAWHREDIANPLGYALFRLFYGAADGRPSEFQLRLPAALFGWATIAATYWAVRPYLHRRVAAGAALIVACSTWHLYWSQNARFYTLAQLAGIVAGGLVLRGLWRPSWARFVLGFVLVAFAALVHPSVAFVGAGLLLAPLVLRVQDHFEPDEEMGGVWRAHFFIALVAAFGASGWLFEVWYSWDTKKGGGSPLHFVLATGFSVTPALGLGFLVGCLHLLRRPRGPALLVGLVALFALGTALLLSFLARVSAQYVFALLPWIAIVAALPLAEPEPPAPPRPAPRWKLAYLALVVGPMLVETTLYYTVRNGDRPPWREAYEFVYDHREEHDLVLGMEVPVAEYYLHPRKDDLRRWKEVLWLDRYRARVPFDWARYPRRIWLVVNREQLEDWEREDREAMQRFLDEECRVAARFPVPWTPRDLDVEVLVYE